MSKLKISDMKQIIYEIAKEESEKENIDIDVHPYTFLQYYNSDLFRKLFKIINKKRLITLPLHAGATNFHLKNDSDKIIVFLYGKILNPTNDSKNQMVYLVRKIYHEIKHTLQKETMKDDENSFEEFIYSMEYILVQFQYKDYVAHHNSFYMEAEADLYAIDKTYDYLKRKGLLTKENEKLIETLRGQYVYIYNDYDPQLIFEKFTNYIKGNISKFNYEKSWLSSIYDEQGNMKSSKEILEGGKLKEFNQGIQYVILSSEPFIENLDFETISDEDKSLVLAALQYTYENYLERLKMYNKNQNTNQGIMKKILLKMEIIAIRLNIYVKLMRNNQVEYSLEQYYQAMPYFIDALKYQLSMNNIEGNNIEKNR